MLGSVTYQKDLGPDLIVLCLLIKSIHPLFRTRKESVNSAAKVVLTLPFLGTDTCP